MPKFAKFAKQGAEQGIQFQRASEPDGIHTVTGLEFDAAVKDSNGDDTVIVKTAKGQVRLYQNGHDLTIKTLLRLAESTDSISIAYYHEPRGGARDGTWLRTRAGEPGDPELSKHMERKGQSRSTATTQRTTGSKAREALKSQTPAKQPAVATANDAVESDDMPF